MPTVSEISARLSGDNSNFRSVMSDSEQVAGRTGQSILKKLDLSNASIAIAAAVGISITDIAEHIARGIANMSKETEDNYKRLASLSSQVADASIANARANLTVEEQYRLALVERGNLERRINSNNGASLEEQVRLKEDQLALENKISAIRALEDRQQEKRNRIAETEASNRERLNEAQRTAGIEQLSAFKQVAIIKQEIADLEKIIATGALSEANASELSVKLTDRKIELLKAEKQLNEENAKVKESEVTITGVITQEIEKQKESVVDLVAEEEKRLRIAKGVAMAAKMTADAYAVGVGATTQSRFGSREIQDASDATLKEIVRRNQDELMKREQNPGGPFDIDKTWPILQLRNEIAKINEELGLRTTIRNNVARMGVEGARRTFDGNPLVFDRLVEQFAGQRDKIDKTNQLLERLNEKIAGGIQVRSITTPSANAFAA